MPCEATKHPEPASAPRVHETDALTSGDPPLDLTKMATLGTLACMLAHEMNNLLTPVLNYARLALDAPANVSLTRRAHENAIASALACNAMAESLLGFAQQGGRAELAANLADAADCAIRCLPRELSKDAVSLARRIPADLTASIPPTALTQVLLNLILNAREAMPSGGDLTIEAERSTWNTDDPVVVLRVTDTGRGIEKDDLCRVFRPFVSGSPERRGCGLGLAICQRLIVSAGGDIRVESQPGVGTTFTIELPEFISAASETVG